MRSERKVGDDADARNGVRLATDIYRPKKRTGPVPIWVRTPYKLHFGTCTTACRPK